MAPHVPQAAGPRGLVPVDHGRVTFTGGPCKRWQDLVRDVTVPSLHRRLEEEGFVEVLDFDEPPGPLVRPVQPSGLSMQHFFDSDFGKWIEAAGHLLRHRRDPALESAVDAIAERYAKGQLADGYLNAWFIRREPDRRWTNLRDWHEMYSLGHLVEGAIAYAEATGKTRLLDVVVRAVDHAATLFGPKPGQRRGYDAHAELELALVKLARFTGDERHLAFARYLVDERGRMPSYFDEEARARREDPAAYVYGTYAYSQAHRPVREQTEVVGHAVRAMYLYSAMADVARETADDELAETCDRLFDRVVGVQLYVTGGLGPSASNEGFTRPYDLPNGSAYAETCAAIGLAFWSQRLDRLRLDGRHGDMVETVLFNGALAGLSADGEHYFYDNVLESRGEHRRWRWHECPCCATNVARFVASAGGFVCSTGERALAVHQYAACVVETFVAGVRLRLEQETDYPWAGRIRIRLAPERPVALTLFLRIPGWCREATLSVAGETVDAIELARDGYVGISRTWRHDEITLDLAMPIDRLSAHPAVDADAGRIALRRGPVVYCVEEADTDMPPQRLRLPRRSPLTARFDPALLGGAVIIEGEALAASDAGWEGGLYRADAPILEPRPFRAIPYHLWANREPGAMAVWLLEA
jgi:uncharacterized protein